MSWTKYIFVHLLKNWSDTWKGNFMVWLDLIIGRYEDYVLTDDEIPFDECRAAFWAIINTDWTEGKRFLEHLMKLEEDLKNGRAIELD